MRILKSALLLALLTVLLVGCISIPIGDGNKMKIGKDGITFIDEEDGETKISFDDEEISIVTGDGEEAGKLSFDGEEGLNFNFSGEDEDFNWSMGVDLELPEDLPYNIPIPENGNVIQYGTSGHLTGLSYIIEEDAERIVKLYDDFFAKAKLPGEAEINDYSAEDGVFKNYHVETDDTFIEVIIIGSTEEAVVSVTITIEERK